MSLFEESRYGRLAREHQAAYRSADPFPHAVIDDFLPPEVCARLADEFPSSHQIDWVQFQEAASIKSASKCAEDLPPYIRSILFEFNSVPFLRFLECLTGIEKLISDPYFEGGGLHRIERGGFLKIHADFNRHPTLGLDRRINALLFLNRDWREEWGGHLELWNRSMTRCVRKVTPVLNRCVIFNTTDHAYHGHPDKLDSPPGVSRRSLALYYYTSERPKEEHSNGHTTLYHYRPNEADARLRFSREVRRFCHKVLLTAADWVRPPLY